MGDMVSVPAEKIAALREIVEQGYVRFNPHELYRRARAVVDTDETEDQDWPFTKERPRHLWEGNFTPAPSPARDDAEKCKHPFPARYPDGLHHCRDCGLSWDEPPAHMAAPDELTALRADLEVQQKQNKELAAERDALRKRIRALADQGRYDPRGVIRELVVKLDALLGDA